MKAPKPLKAILKGLTAAGVNSGTAQADKPVVESIPVPSETLVDSVADMSHRATYTAQS